MDVVGYASFKRVVAKAGPFKYVFFSEMENTAKTIERLLAVDRDRAVYVAGSTGQDGLVRADILTDFPDAVEAFGIQGVY